MKNKTLKIRKEAQLIERLKAEAKKPPTKKPLKIKHYQITKQELPKQKPVTKKSRQEWEEKVTRRALEEVGVSFV